MEQPPARILDRWFPPGGVVRTERLSGGYLNDVFRVDTHDARYALRVGVATTTAAMVAWELRVLEHVANRGVPVPRALPALDGSLLAEQDGRVAVLLTFVEGETPDRLRREHRLAAARTLARLHQALKDFQASPRPGWAAEDGAARYLADVDWRENRLWSWQAARRDLLALDRALLPAQVDPQGIVEQVEHHLEVVGERTRALHRDDLPVQVIHGDYWAGNLRVVGDEVVGVFDWDDTRHDWRALEVGRSTWEFCRNATKDAFVADEVEEFLDAYIESGGEILPEERAVFPRLVAACRLTETLWDFALSPPASRTLEDWEYLRATLRLLRRLEG